MNKVIVTITGRSASGKSTLEEALIQNPVFGKVVSLTTRQPRSGEVNGQHYYFVTEEEFDNVDDLVESNRFNGTSYGAARSEFERHFSRGKIPVVVLDPNGLKQIISSSNQLGWTVLSVYLDNPPHVVFERLVRRFLADFTSDYSDHHIKSFARRLSTIETEESTWRPVGDSMNYSKFDETNMEDAVKKITLRALRLREQYKVE